jgi:hypothetical protein
MSRRIVFAGSAQTRALARIYRAEVAGQTGDDVVFIGTGAVGTDAARSTLLLADIVAMEVDEDGDAIPADAVPGQAAIVRIPNLYCDFLWPFAGRAHPRNRGAFALPGGPYPAEHGDRFLDQMVAENVDEDTAIARYKAMNIAAEGELDSRLADRTAILQQLDAAAGYDLAGFITDRFRSEPLFRTRQRVTMPLLRRLVDQLFGKLGVQGWTAESLRRVPFPAGAQPIHPGVIAHFGLSWVGPDQEYPVNEEGFFSFDAFARRYMRFTWNETLHRGIQTAKTDPAAALADLERGLADSPESPLGRLALAAARRAAGIDSSPANPFAVIDEDSYDPILEQQGAEDASAAAMPEPAMPEPAMPEPAMPQTGAFADAAEPEADLLEAAAPHVPDHPAPGHADFAHDAGAEAPAAGPGSTAEDELIAEAAPVEEEAPRVTRFPVPPRPATLVAHDAAPDVTHAAAPSPGSAADGFTDFHPAAAPAAAEPAAAAGSHDLIDVLPRLLPVFGDLAGAADRPFDTMPELMPPPPLRPILPPELQGDAPKQGLLARILGRK